MLINEININIPVNLLNVVIFVLFQEFQDTQSIALGIFGEERRGGIGEAVSKV